MRLTGYVMFGLLTITLAFPAMAQQQPTKSGRNFGSINCQPSFACADTANMDLASLAASCSASGLGTSGDFSNALLDSDNCMSAPVGDNGKMSSSNVCCITPLQGQDGICKMNCSFMLYQ